MNRGRAEWGGGTWRAVACTLLLLTTQLSACADDLTGPGTYRVVVAHAEGITPGAVVVELHGGGFTSVSGVGLTETFAADSVGAARDAETLRVVVVGSGEPLTFEVQVAETGGTAPGGAIIQVVDLDNELVSANGYRIVMDPVR